MGVAIDQSGRDPASLGFVQTRRRPDQPLRHRGTRAQPGDAPLAYRQRCILDGAIRGPRPGTWSRPPSPAKPSPLAASEKTPNRERRMASRGICSNPETPAAAYRPRIPGNSSPCPVSARFAAYSAKSACSTSCAEVLTSRSGYERFDAGADGHHLVLAARMRDSQLAHRQGHLLGQPAGTGQVRARQQQGDFLTAVTGRNIARPVQQGRDRTGDRLQTGIPRLVTIQIVELLELVDIQQGSCRAKMPARTERRNS